MASFDDKFNARASPRGPTDPLQRPLDPSTSAFQDLGTDGGTERGGVHQPRLESLRGNRARHQLAQTEFVKRDDGGEIEPPERVVDHA